VPTAERLAVPGVPLPWDQRRTWQRYVALGDSLSEGLGDPAPGGATRGCAALLADRLRRDEPQLQFVNLAVRGYMVRHALERQLQPALALEPDLVSIFIGGNDCLLRPTLRRDRFASDLDRLVAPFAARSTTVVMSTLPDLTACSPLPHPYRAVLRRRLTCVNAVIEDVSRRHSTVLLDAWSDPRTRRHSMWSIDRIHPSADGHRLIAASIAELLGLPVEPADVRPPTSHPLGIGRRHLAELEWLLRHGLRRGRTAEHRPTARAHERRRGT
jgi:lysophospholipase L1-like esterase